MNPQPSNFIYSEYGEPLISANKKFVEIHCARNHENLGENDKNDKRVVANR